MLCGAHGWLLFRGVRKPPRHGTARGCLFRAPARLRGYAHVHVAGAVSVTGEGAHGGGRYSQLLRVVSSSSKRRLVEPLLLGCGLVSRSRLRGGRPLSPATRTRPVLLDVVPLLALRRRARRGLAMLDRDDAETVGRRLRPLLLLAALVRVLARLLRPSDGDDRALHECRVLSVAAEQGHVVERHPAVLPLLSVTVELPEVLSDRERCARLPVLPELDLRVSGETPFKTDVSHVLVVLHLGCGVLDLVKFGGGCACPLSCDEVVAQLVHRLERGDGLRFGVLR